MTRRTASKSKSYQASIIILVFLLFGYISSFCQTAIVSTFNEVSNSTGKVSYSVGQSYTLQGTGSNGKIVNGIQQPFNIYTLGVDEVSPAVNISIFPNPTCKELILKADEDKISKMSYSLYDMNGTLIDSKQLWNSETLIQMSGLQVATYLLKVMDSGKIIKTFKVIKNQN
jgi:hypothetical protein